MNAYDSIERGAADECEPLTGRRPRTFTLTQLLVACGAVCVCAIAATTVVSTHRGLANFGYCEPRGHRDPDCHKDHDGYDRWHRDKDESDRDEMKYMERDDEYTPLERCIEKCVDDYQSSKDSITDMHTSNDSITDMHTCVDECVEKYAK